MGGAPQTELEARCSSFLDDVQVGVLLDRRCIESVWGREDAGSWDGVAPPEAAGMRRPNTGGCRRLPATLPLVRPTPCAPQESQVTLLQLADKHQTPLPLENSDYQQRLQLLAAQKQAAAGKRRRRRSSCGTRAGRNLSNSKLPLPCSLFCSLAFPDLTFFSYNDTAGFRLAAQAVTSSAGICARVPAPAGASRRRLAATAHQVARAVSGLVRVAAALAAGAAAVEHRSPVPKGPGEVGQRGVGAGEARLGAGEAAGCEAHARVVVLAVAPDAVAAGA